MHKIKGNSSKGKVVPLFSKKVAGTGLVKKTVSLLLFLLIFFYFRILLITSLPIKII